MAIPTQFYEDLEKTEESKWESIVEKYGLTPLEVKFVRRVFVGLPFGRLTGGSW